MLVICDKMVPCKSGMNTRLAQAAVSGPFSGGQMVAIGGKGFPSASGMGRRRKRTMESIVVELLG